jgi:hypothetical protein
MVDGSYADNVCGCDGICEVYVDGYNKHINSGRTTR